MNSTETFHYIINLLEISITNHFALGSKDRLFLPAVNIDLFLPESRGENGKESKTLVHKRLINLSSKHSSSLYLKVRLYLVGEAKIKEGMKR